jgi:hypothetical protein
MDVDTEPIHSSTMITADQQELKYSVVSKSLGRIFKNKTPILFV